MTKAEDLKAEYEAALEVAELEDELVTLKQGGDPDELRAVKDQLRELRRAQREAREAAGAAAPDAIEATATPEGV